MSVWPFVSPVNVKFRKKTRTQIDVIKSMETLEETKEIKKNATTFASPRTTK